MSPSAEPGLASPHHRETSVAGDLRLLMTADGAGGVWTYALDLARALYPYGVSTTLATMGPRPDAWQLAQASTVPGLSVVASDYKLEWMDDPWDDVRAAGTWLLDLERALRPDIVHLNSYALAALPWRQRPLVVAHSSVASWAESVPNGPSTSALRAYTDAVARGLRAAARVVATSGWMLASLRHHYGFDGPSQVIANGRSDARLSPAPKEPFLLAVGRRHDRAKNLAAVTAIAPALSWPLAVAGDDDDDDDHDYAAGHRRDWSLGRLAPDQMAGWLSRASVVVQPARYEPFGLLPLEAALCGCALVLGDIPSLREVWHDAADFVVPDDADGLRRHLARLIASPSRLAARAAAARARASAFTAERMAHSYIRTYSQLLAAPTQHRRSSCVL